MEEKDSGIFILRRAVALRSECVALRLLELPGLKSKAVKTRWYPTIEFHLVTQVFMDLTHKANATVLQCTSTSKLTINYSIQSHPASIIRGNVVDAKLQPN
jgi:hypothetical protein